MGCGIVEVHIGLQAAGVEDGQGDGRESLEGAEWAKGGAIDDRAAHAGKPRDHDRGKEKRLGLSDARVGRHQLLLGQEDIGPTS